VGSLIGQFDLTTERHGTSDSALLPILEDRFAFDRTIGFECSLGRLQSEPNGRFIVLWVAVSGCLQIPIETGVSPPELLIQTRVHGNCRAAIVT
jgi:hypothetical protein